MKCETCRYYELGRPNAIMHKEGICKRYPQQVNMMKANWCGEHQAKPRKRPKKPTKK